jgi:hypothetical protein
MVFLSTLGLPTTWMTPDLMEAMILLIPLSAFRKVQGYESPSTQAFEFFTMPLV